MTPEPPAPDGPNPGPGDGAAPWSPFPVQDWSTMPDPMPQDPYTDNLWLNPGLRADPSVALVDPAWAPPSTAPRWLPPVALLLAFALAAAGLITVARVSRGVEPPSSRYLPADGAAWAARSDPASGPTGIGLTTANESARLGLLEATQSVSGKLGAAVLGSIGSTDGPGIRAGRAWRVISTDTASSAASGQRSRIYRTDRGVELIADSGPAGTEVYTPALRELPADPQPGDHWTSSGHTRLGRSFSADFSAEAGPDDCLQVRGMINFTGSATEDPGRRTVERTWCPGRGVVRASEQSGSITSTETITDPGAPLGATNVNLQARSTPWPRPTGWTARSTQIHAADPQLGDAPLSSLPTPVPPVITGSGLLVRAVTQGSDLVVAAPPTKQGQAWQVLRRLHPGGTVSMLAGYGDLIVVGTTQRRLVAYRPDGQRAWQHDLNDLVDTVPARSGSAIAVLSASGAVRMIDLPSGQLRWQTEVRADIGAGGAADDNAVLVADRSGSLRAFDAATGAQRWRVDLADPASALVIAGGRLQLVNGSDLDTRSLADGALLSRHAVPGNVRALRAVGDLAVLAGTVRTEVVAPTGRLAWSRDGYDDLTTDGTVIVGWRSTRAEVITADGRAAGRYTFEAPRTSENRQYLRYGDGILAVSTVYNDLTVWS